MDQQPLPNKMVTLYVANCTMQNAILYYRTRFNDDGSSKDENRRFEAPRQMPIASGRQVVFGQRQMNMSQAMEIIGQLANGVGLTDVEDVKKTKDKVPFVFNLDRPVPSDVMKMAAERNSALMTMEGQVRRKRAAVAVSDIVVQAAAAEAAKRGQDEAERPNVQVAFEQLEQSEAGERTIAEGYKVDAAAAAPKGGLKNRGRRGK